MASIDINSDLGEGFGPYSVADDAAIMKRVTSANIACGAHAGTPLIMDETLALAKAAKVRVGGHVGYPDREGFGRRPMHMSSRELSVLTTTQLGALAALCRNHGLELAHANFHGALGNLTFSNADAARAVLQAIKDFDPRLRYIGLPDSEAMKVAERLGLRTIKSFLADRGYIAPGRLAPRGTEGSVIKDPARVRQRVAQTLSSGLLTLTDGTTTPIEIQSILVHSDTPGALDLAQAIRSGILDAGYEVARYR